MLRLLVPLMLLLLVMVMVLAVVVVVVLLLGLVIHNAFFGVVSARACTDTTPRIYTMWHGPL